MVSTRCGTISPYFLKAVIPTAEKSNLRLARLQLDHACPHQPRLRIRSWAQWRAGKKLISIVDEPFNSRHCFRLQRDSGR